MLRHADVQVTAAHILLTSDLTNSTLTPFQVADRRTAPVNGTSRQLPAGLCNMARRQMSLEARAALKSKYRPIFRESSKAAMSEGGAKGSAFPKARPRFRR